MLGRRRQTAHGVPIQEALLGEEAEGLVRGKGGLAGWLAGTVVVVASTCLA